jgi:predicted O-methyltransferase YrrM
VTMPSFQEIDEVLANIIAPADDALQHALDTSAAGGLPAIQVAALQGRLLELLVRLVDATTVLEVGTLGGYSTIQLARGLRDGGRVTTLELDPHHAEVARANFEYAGLSDRIEVMVGPALDSLASLESSGFGPVDLVFIDADKPNNPNYLRHGLSLARPGTLLVVDNVVRGGTVAVDPLPDDNARGAREAIQFMADEPRIRGTVLQLVGQKGHDGIAIGLVTS